MGKSRASYFSYRVSVLLNGENRSIEFLNGGDGVAFTADSAVDFAHRRSGTHRAGTSIRIDRKRGASADFMPWRSYIVGADGIVRRADGAKRKEHKRAEPFLMVLSEMGPGPGDVKLVSPSKESDTRLREALTEAKAAGKKGRVMVTLALCEDES